MRRTVYYGDGHYGDSNRCRGFNYTGVRIFREVRLIYEKQDETPPPCSCSTEVQVPERTERTEVPPTDSRTTIVSTRQGTWTERFTTENKIPLPETVSQSLVRRNKDPRVPVVTKKSHICSLSRPLLPGNFYRSPPHGWTSRVLFVDLICRSGRMEVNDHLSLHFLFLCFGCT